MTERPDNATDCAPGMAEPRAPIAHEDEFYTELEREIAVDQFGDDPELAELDARPRGTRQPPRPDETPTAHTASQPSGLRRAAAPVFLLSALAIGALAHGAVADKILPSRPAIPDMAGTPISLSGAWRRLPAPNAEAATLDSTVKESAITNDPRAFADAIDPMGEAPSDTVSSVHHAGSPPAPDTQDQTGFLPMAFDAICALPLVQVAVAPSSASALGLTGEQAAPHAHVDSQSLTVMWPMLEPWSRLPGEPAPAVLSARARASLKTLQVGAAAAARPLPPSEPEPQPAAAPAPRPRPVTLPAVAATAPTPSLVRTFEAVAKDSP